MSKLGDTIREYAEELTNHMFEDKGYCPDKVLGVKIKCLNEDCEECWIRVIKNL